MRAAAIYARISKDRFGDAQTVRRQEAECRSYAEGHGHEVAQVYVDNDISAYKAKARPAYGHMCEDLKAGIRDGVITYHLDRLHRNMIELEEFIILIEAQNVEVRTVSGGDFDLSTSDGRFMARVVGGVARKESEDKSRRIKSAKRSRALKGMREASGRRPYGYSDDGGRLVGEEARIIKEAATRILAGESLTSLCRDLNDRGVQTVSGKPWRVTTVRRILASGRISGQVEHLGEIVAKATWPPVISPAETTRLRSLLLDPTRNKRGRSPRRYPLAGVLRCGLCGATLVSRPNSAGTRRYICTRVPGRGGCGKISITAQALEQFIAEAVLYRLDTPDLYRQLKRALPSTEEAEVLQRQIDEDQAQLQVLADLHGRKQISLSEWLAARKPVEERIEAAARTLGTFGSSSALEGYLGDPAKLKVEWGDLSPSRQRAIVTALVEKLVVQPAKKASPRFDPERIEVTWRV